MAQWECDTGMYPLADYKIFSDGAIVYVFLQFCSTKSMEFQLHGIPRCLRGTRCLGGRHLRFDQADGWATEEGGSAFACRWHLVAVSAAVISWCIMVSHGIWLWINTYENSIFRGMNIHKSQLFWCELQGYRVLTHIHIMIIIKWLIGASPGLDSVGQWSLLGQVWGGAVLVHACPVLSFNQTIHLNRLIHPLVSRMYLDTLTDRHIDR